MIGGSGENPRVWPITMPNPAAGPATTPTAARSDQQGSKPYRGDTGVDAGILDEVREYENEIRQRQDRLLVAISRPGDCTQEESRPSTFERAERDPRIACW